MVSVGDIVQIYCPSAGKDKYFICISEIDGEIAAQFLFISSGKSGITYQSDCVFPDTDFPCLPNSPTGKSIVSLSAFRKCNAEQLKVYKAKVLGRVSKAVAATLKAAAEVSRVLTKPEKRITLAALDVIINF